MILFPLVAALRIASPTSAQVVVPLPGAVSAVEPGASLGAAPEETGLSPAVPEAADSGPIDLWPELERRLLLSLGAPLESKTSEWKRAAAERMRSEPTLEVPQALARALVSVHRLPASAADGLLESLKNGGAGRKALEGDPKRIFSMGGRLYAAEEKALKRFSGDGLDDLMGLPPMPSFGDVRRLGDVDYVAGSRGVYARRQGGAWEPVLKPSTHALLSHAGRVYAATENGLLRSNGPSSWTKSPVFGASAVYDIAQIGGRFYASTSQGLFEGTVAAKDVRRELSAISLGNGRLARLRCWLFGAPTTKVRAGDIDWNPEPIFRKTEIKTESHGYGSTRDVEYVLRVFQAAELAGSLRVATENGLFRRNEDGTWRQEIKGESIRRLIPGTDGPLAVGNGFHAFDGKSWSRVFGNLGQARDALELDGVLYLAYSSGLSVVLRLPAAWETALISTIEDALSPAPAPQSAGLKDDQGRIADKGGRTIFQARSE